MIDHFRHPRNLASGKGAHATGRPGAGRHAPAPDRHRPIRYQSYRVEPPPAEPVGARAPEEEFVDLTERADRLPDEPVGAPNAPRATPWYAPSGRRDDDPSVTPAQDASREAARGGVVHALREAARQ